MSAVWTQVMAMKPFDTRRRGVANTLQDHELETILATIDYFGGDYRQDLFDLKTARYRVFDWLAMRIQGRHSGSPHDINATKVLVHSFLKSKGDVDKFIEDLRVTDYEIDESYKEIDLEKE